MVSSLVSKWQGPMSFWMLRSHLLDSMYLQYKKWTGANCNLCTMRTLSEVAWFHNLTRWQKQQSFWPPFMFELNQSWKTGWDGRVRVRSLTTLSKFCPLLTTYLPPLANVACERPLGISGDPKLAQICRHLIAKCLAGSKAQRLQMGHTICHFQDKAEKKIKKMIVTQCSVQE